MTIWRMHIACWIPVYSHTLITCNTYFPLSSVCTNAPQMLPYLYIACLISPGINCEIRNTIHV